MQERDSGDTVQMWSWTRGISHHCCVKSGTSVPINGVVAGAGRNTYTNVKDGEMANALRVDKESTLQSEVNTPCEWQGPA